MHATSVTVGFVLSIAAMGALFGTFIVNWLHDKLSFNSTLTLMLILQICARLPLLYKVNNISIIMVVFIVSACDSILNIAIITNRQDIVNINYFGRVTSIYKTVLIGVNSLGFVYGGAISKALGSLKAILFSNLELFFVLCLCVFLVFKQKEEKMNNPIF